MMGDTHIYHNHIEPLKKQMVRVPMPFPTLEINPEITDIDMFKVEDLKLHNYHHHPKIEMPLSV